ncbi:MAG: purine-nucleoside phosphorylase [Bacillota bacterium]|nr:purine-nucleoside phosphorylase [Bacillota bacterium]
MKIQEQIKRILESAEYISAHLPPAETAIVLGSGVGPLVQIIQDQQALEYSEIPNFPQTTIPGHSGKLIWGRVHGRPVYAFSGRFHYYEGHAPETVILPMRILKPLGVKCLILTNAAGGINTAFQPGDLMLINDHINLSGYNPLRGENIPDWGPRFPDMSYAYDQEYSELLLEIGKEQGLCLHQGVYCGLSGPSFETPAEIRMLRILGADAVGMSTVPEVLAAHQMGIRILAVSCISNMAAGILEQPLSHEEVNETSRKVEQKFCALIEEFLRRLSNEHD